MTHTPMHSIHLIVVQLHSCVCVRDLCRSVAKVRWHLQAYALPINTQACVSSFTGGLISASLLLLELLVCCYAINASMRSGFDR